MSSPSILIVDDDRIFAALAEAVLHAAGSENVTLATEGEADSRLKLEHASKTDLVILDLNMPGFDGLAAMRALRDSGFSGHVAIASGETAAVLRSASQLARLFGLKLAGVISKPLRPGEIEALLARVNAAGQTPDVPKTSVNTAAFKHIVPVFQPKINAASGTVYGAEALMRVVLEDGSTQSPQDHIDRLVAAGELGEASLTFLDAVIKEMKVWQSVGFAPIISINLPAPLFEDAELMSYFISAVQHSGLPAGQFTFELTEAALPSDVTVLLESMTRVRIAGLGLALDDYGTGMANYDILRLCPFSELKIDRSVAQAVVHDRLAGGFVESVLAIARDLDLRLVAEGVETESQVAALRRLGVSLFQGYYFSKPLDSKSFLLMHNQNVGTISRDN
jgi:EAL domain-containing protein (putative c-di-GMP-specific phosphodiesterase class I)